MIYKAFGELRLFEYVLAIKRLKSRNRSYQFFFSIRTLFFSKISMKGKPFLIASSLLLLCRLRVFENEFKKCFPNSRVNLTRIQRKWLRYKFKKYISTKNFYEKHFVLIYFALFYFSVFYVLYFSVSSFHLIIFYFILFYCLSFN